MLTHFTAMAAYNLWANARVYADVEKLSLDDQNRDVGIYFGSVFGTLSHLLRTDRAWMYILQGGALTDMRPLEPPGDFPSLRAARNAHDEALIAWIGAQNDAWLNRPFAFTSGLGSFAGMTYSGTHAGILTHLFNHQTHHRGQAHAALTILGIKEPNGLDLLIKGS